ncbi:serine hydrolase [Actinomadura darangshiensis]|uniref:Serine hydrolase n=1 Tax=Actinomadura darangshiensis TaxID=705336 RepID=A0A4R5A483_9ACTN|nr:serine hydrolase [Actinomadura darangshiensis]TDD66681.1 serine hydrolase [Actinomadura darangshiensis]
MRRHLIVLALAAGATGAGVTAHLFTADGPQRRSGTVVNATESIPSRRGAAVVEEAARPFDAAALRQAVRAYVRKRPGKAGVMATDLRTGLSFGENEKGRFVTASIVKVDILATLVLQRQRDGRRLSGGERELAGRMIRESDNSAADALYSDAGYGPGVRKANKTFGLKQTKPFPTSWGSSLTSPADQVRLLANLASDRSPLKATGRQYILGLMGSVLDEQAWGVSAAARPGERVALKNGWAPIHNQGNGWAINSVGRISGPGHDFLIAVCSGDNPTMETGVSTVEHVAGMVVGTMRGARP